MDILKVFSYCYSKTIQWSRHHHAPYYLATVSFAESSFFPIPPDVMLISMGLATPDRAWRYALIATLFSVIGGLFGYLIGYYGMEILEPYIMASSYAHAYQVIAGWFNHHSGLGIVLIASFTPFPYKIFTITAGAMHMSWVPFLLGSLLGRGLRFFLICAAMYFTGAKLEQKLRRYIDLMGWCVLGIIAFGYVLVKWVL